MAKYEGPIQVTDIADRILDDRNSGSPGECRLIPEKGSARRHRKSAAADVAIALLVITGVATAFVLALSFSGLHHNTSNPVQLSAHLDWANPSWRAAPPHLLAGWSAVEERHVWSEAHTAKLRLPKRDDGEVTRVHLVFFTAGLGSVPQSITIASGGVGIWNETTNGSPVDFDLMLDVPNAATAGGDLILDITVDPLVVPADYGGSDRRTLGVAHRAAEVSDN